MTEALRAQAPEPTEQRMVLIACPVNDGLVPTGLESTGLAELPPTSVLTGCPDCGGDHRWTPEEAVLALSWPADSYSTDA